LERNREGAVRKEQSMKAEQKSRKKDGKQKRKRIKKKETEKCNRRKQIR
jgi:hypothetical protein